MFSVPAYDSQVPDRVVGTEIGSSKQVVQPGDVLLSKIVPHIRRAWIVPGSDERRQIGSSEWIIFRSPKFYGPFLRHVLLSDQFNSKLMQTVSGVGGSLLRARPTGVARIKISLPPLEAQRRIAATLDQAEELRAKRRAAIALLDQLPQAKFLEMFGDPSRFPESRLDEACSLITDGTHYTPTYVDDGVVFLSAKNVTSGSIDWQSVKHIPLTLHQELQKRVSPRRGDLLLAKNGTTGVAAIVDRDAVFDIYVSLALLRCSDRLVPEYLHAALNSTLIRRQFDGVLKGIGVPNLHLVEIRKANIPLPPLKLQRDFADRIQAIQRARAGHQSALVKLDALFASLQSCAFRGCD